MDNSLGLNHLLWHHMWLPKCSHISSCKPWQLHYPTIDQCHVRWMVIQGNEQKFPYSYKRYVTIGTIGFRVVSFTKLHIFLQLVLGDYTL